MTAKELIRRLAGIPVEFAARDVVIAKSAYLMNLLRVCKVYVPDDLFDAGTPNDVFFFHFGILVGKLGQNGEIEEAALKEAHLAMSMPWSRAVVSRLLYGEDGKPVPVTAQGIPTSYGM